ncbi:hypothetical protein F2Q69_00037056 [Brassica cretica]|uniref:GRF-type domain-containing protein n=1 Tax=Brassica cretica TaxID=69181 RepID=A0A8S9SGM5_BRACR|nr:hypothetical protein F2Q69_00037056 [Brassica cretica]
MEKKQLTFYKTCDSPKATISQTSSTNAGDHEIRPEGVKAAKSKRNTAQGKSLAEYTTIWEMKKEDLAMKEKLSKLAILDTLLAKKEPLSEAEEVKLNMGHDYSYSQPSESEDYGGNSVDSGYSETEDLIRRDQAEISYNARAPVQYPPQPEVEFGFPQTCYCGGQPLLATSNSRNDLGFTGCSTPISGDCNPKSKRVSFISLTPHGSPPPISADCIPNRNESPFPSSVNIGASEIPPFSSQQSNAPSLPKVTAAERSQRRKWTPADDEENIVQQVLMLERMVQRESIFIKWLNLNTPKDSGSSKRKTGEPSSQTSSTNVGDHEIRPEVVKPAKSKRNTAQGKSLVEYTTIWEMKKEDLAMKEKLSKLAILDTLLAKKEPLTEAEEVKLNMGHDYSYSQPSESEDYGGNSVDSGYSKTKDLIRRDQAEIRYNARAPAHYPPQPEVEFGFPQTCYCGGQPLLATSDSRNDPGRRYYTCENVDDRECHVGKWWDVAVMEEMRARDRHVLQLAEKVDNLTLLSDYETEQKLTRLEKIVCDLGKEKSRFGNGFE